MLVPAAECLAISWGRVTFARAHTRRHPRMSLFLSQLIIAGTAEYTGINSVTHGVFV